MRLLHIFGGPKTRRIIKQFFLLLYSWRRVILTPLILITLYIFYYRKTFFRDLDYYVRPLWGKPARLGPSKIITHFYAENIPASKCCIYHQNWTARSPEELPRVFDAFTFSIELDLLEIRLKELWSVVDIFVIVEADKTFQGKDKRLYFAENSWRFKWAAGKIKHFVVTSLSKYPQALFENEARMRNEITQFIHSLAPKRGDLIIASDIDEIPSRKAVELVKMCTGYPKELHFLVEEYMYSFEYPLRTNGNWRPHVTIYDPGNFNFHHIILKGTELMLADAGWHCSWCFRRIKDFQFKMTSYSHVSYVEGNEEWFLDGREIQRRICEGVDIFEMPPEAYKIKEFIERWGVFKRKMGTGGIPSWVVEEMERFRFLLPGGCLREDYNEFNLGLEGEIN